MNRRTLLQHLVAVAVLRCCPPARGCRRASGDPAGTVVALGKAHGRMARGGQRWAYAVLFEEDTEPSASSR